MSINQNFSLYALKALVETLGTAVFGVNPPTYSVMRLYKAAPDPANLATNLAAYVGYADVQYVTSADAVFQWTAGTPPVGQNKNAIVFPLNSGGTTETITHLLLARPNSAGSAMIYSVAIPLDAPLVVSPGVQPVIAAGAILLTGSL